MCPIFRLKKCKCKRVDREREKENILIQRVFSSILLLLYSFIHLSSHTFCSVHTSRMWSWKSSNLDLCIFMMMKQISSDPKQNHFSGCSVLKLLVNYTLTETLKHHRLGVVSTAGWICGCVCFGDVLPSFSHDCYMSSDAVLWRVIALDTVLTAVSRRVLVSSVVGVSLEKATSLGWKRWPCQKQFVVKEWPRWKHSALGQWPHWKYSIVKEWPCLKHSEVKQCPRWQQSVVKESDLVGSVQHYGNDLIVSTP